MTPNFYLIFNFNLSEIHMGSKFFGKKMFVPGRSEDKLWQASTNKLPGTQGAIISCSILSYLAMLLFVISCHKL